jgi:tetratricopeptide (TPR) repeat protein
LGHAARQSGRLGEAVGSYQRAIQINPDHKEAYYGLASALLSQGDLAATMDACGKCLQLDPLCQHALAYQSIAQYGLNKKEDAKRLTDFTTMIRKAQISTPSAFDDAVSFNEALVADIRAHPSLKWEPYDRVTRGGSVTRDLLESPTPRIVYLEQALRGAINEFTESLPADASHPFFGTVPEAYSLTLIASVLKAGGRHPSHIHEGAWLSGVYYAKVPSVVSEHDKDHAGWLEFGRPDCDAPVDCELQVGAVAPEAGTLVMFPSYFFHHTIPYQGIGERIGVAFDVYRLR